MVRPSVFVVFQNLIGQRGMPVEKLVKAMGDNQ
jgi:hypothetical protein